MVYSRKAKIAALLVCVVFCCAMAFSALFIIAEADHDCTGEHCPICYQISVCQNTLKQLALAVTAAAFAAALTYIFVWHVIHTCDLNAPTTLITLKVKLSN